jgi:hypothetical protein
MEIVYFVILSLQLAVGIWTIRKRIIEQSILIEMFRPRNVVKGSELIFLKRINKLGDTDTIENQEEISKMYQEDDFQITCLSMYQETYIAHGFSTFVVKIKTKIKWKNN